MVKYVNKMGVAVKITERGKLAETTLQDGEELELQANTDEIIAEPAI